jgi:hypothetical protein
MDRTRDQLLAGAGLAQDQHRGVGNGHVFDVRENFAQRLASAEDLVGTNQRTDFFAQIFCFDRERANFLLGFQPLVYVSKYDCLEGLALDIEARQRSLR